MDGVHIESLDDRPIGERAVEIVERKGLGHPDTLCDSIMERVSQELCRVYMREFGRPLHHNCDKGLLVAGEAEHRFGGGRIIAPMKLIFGDRATSRYGDRNIDVGDIAISAAKAWLRDHLPRVDPETDLVYQVELRPGSEPLTGLFESKSTIVPANDTSAAVGYAPLTETEHLVHAAERELRSVSMRTRFPELGDDIKVMGIRRNRELELTIAAPLLDRYIGSAAHYHELKAGIGSTLQNRLSRRLQHLDALQVRLNMLDAADGGVDSIYLTVKGLSAESADSGAVGRGNRVNGLIPLLRPRGAEAAAGKNPYSHAGKIYSVLSQQLAEQIVDEIPEVSEAVVWLCSRIGASIAEPARISVALRSADGIIEPSAAERVNELIAARFHNIARFCEELAAGAHPVC